MAGIIPAVKPSRRTQPYRKSPAGRPGGASLAAMLKGRTAGGVNPQDLQRQVGKRHRRRLAQRMKRLY